MLKMVIVADGIMTENEVKEYYDEWAQIGRVYDSGDYFDIFKTSDLMITDCGSFLAEYLLSDKPLIRLVNSKGIAMNKLGCLFTDSYYNAYTNEELLKYFVELVQNKNDYLKEHRMKMSKLLIDRNEAAAHKIYVDILKRLKIKL